MNTVVMGFGNPLRRDDGVGYWLAQELQARGYNALPFLQALPEQVYELASAERVVLIDADLSLPAGGLSWRPVVLSASLELNHGLEPQGLLTLAQALLGRFPIGYAFSVGIADWDYGEGFSPQVQAVLPLALMELERFLGGPCTS